MWMMMVVMVMVILKNNEGDEAHVVVIFIGAKIMYCYTRCMMPCGCNWVVDQTSDCIPKVAE